MPDELRRESLQRLEDPRRRGVLVKEELEVAYLGIIGSGWFGSQRNPYLWIVIRKAGC